MRPWRRPAGESGYAAWFDGAARIAPHRENRAILIDLRLHC
jgi:hypothetical protein